MLQRLSSALVKHKGVTLSDTITAMQEDVVMKQHVVYLEEYQGKGDGVTDNADAISAALTNLTIKGGGVLQLKAGTYLSSKPIDLKHKYVSIKGNGILATKLKASASMVNFLDLEETEDARISPISISDMTIDGAGVAANVINLRYRHYTNFTNVIFTGGGSYAAQLRDAWLNTFFNCGFEGSTAGLYLRGGNHRSSFYSCSFQGNTNQNIIVRKESTANDGNMALYFANCDVEFATGTGIDFDGSDATFDCCYLGENIGNSVFNIYSGNIRVRGGVGFFGYTQGTYFVNFSGRGDAPATFTVEGMTINGQTHAAFASLVNGTNGKASFSESPFYFPTGGNFAMNGNLLLDKKSGTVFAPRLGYEYSQMVSNVTVDESSNGSAKTVTAATVPGPSPVFGLGAPLYSNKWDIGKKLAMIVTYSSNVDFKVKTANSVLGAGEIIGSLPSTNGAVKTGILYLKDATASEATRLEFYRDGVVAVGHTFTLHRVSFGDHSAGGFDFSPSGSNLYHF